MKDFLNNISMLLNKTNINKFSFGEAMSNSNGKTSGSKFAGFITLCVGGIGFLISIISALCGYTESVALTSICAGVISTALVLFGYSKNKATKDSTNIEIKDEI